MHLFIESCKQNQTSIFSKLSVFSLKLLILFQNNSNQQYYQKGMQPLDLNLTTSYKSSPNIAWVKYWGKYDEDYILPINDSLGLTLSQNDISTTTLINFSIHNQHHSLTLNSQPHPISNRILKMFNRILDLAYKRKYSKQMSRQAFMAHKFKIQSENSFPTASGMASSASGLACLAGAVNGLFGELMSNDELSELARLGSGSASRSVWGGLVYWAGVNNQLMMDESKIKDCQILQKLSKECISKSVVGHEKLGFVKVIILLANNKKKQISSTSGMETSVKTSELIKHRNIIARNRSSTILQTLNRINSGTLSDKQYKDCFNLVSETIIKDSNQFHAICLDTYPPIFYLNEFSKQVMHIVDHIINPCVDYKVAYTFDAGPHAFLFMHEKIYERVFGYFVELYQWRQKSDKFNKRGNELLKKINQAEKEMEGDKFGDFSGQIIEPYQIWVTEGGDGVSKNE